MARRPEKPLTKEAMEMMVEGVAAQLASYARMPWWSCMDERLKREYRKTARERLVNRTIAGIPRWQDPVTLEPLSPDQPRQETK